MFRKSHLFSYNGFLKVWFSLSFNTVEGSTFLIKLFLYEKYSLLPRNKKKEIKNLIVFEKL